MRYFRIKPYDVLSRVAGRPLTTPKECNVCRQIIRSGETDLRVQFVDPPPYPDVLGVLFGPEWVVTPGLMRVICKFEPLTHFAQVSDVNNNPLDYFQVIVNSFINISKKSIRSGKPCPECGCGAQMNLNHIYVELGQGLSPALARIFEAKSVYVAREDLAEEMDKNFDIDIEEVHCN